MNAKSDVSFNALDDIRDHAYLLSLGSAFLCEDPFLVKIGTYIDSRIDEVKKNIASLKKLFPGKFVSEVNTDDILESLRELSRRLEKPDKEIHEKCKTGELGRDLEDTVRSLTRAIKTVRDQVEGVIPSYSKTDSALGLFRRIGTAGSLVGLIAKWLLPLLVAAVFAFSFLFVTMEREGTFLEKIARSEETIRSQQKKLSELVLEKETVSGKIEDIRRIDMGREDKIAVLELSIKVQDLDKKIENIREDIQAHEVRIQNNRKKIEEMRTTSFLKKLMRR